MNPKQDKTESYGLLKALSTICKDATRLMVTARERELTKMERFGLKSHVRGCKSCQRFMQQLDVVDALVEETEDVSTLHVSEAMPTKTRQRVRQKVLAKIS